MTEPGIGHNSKARREDLERIFKERTREQRIADNTPFDLRWQWEVWLSELSPNGKLVAFAVRAYASSNGCDSYPSIDALSHLTGLSRRAVIQQLKHIETALLLTIERGKGRATSTYKLAIPDKTMSELSTAMEAASGDRAAPQGECSGYGKSPQTRSGDAGAPLNDDVVVTESNHEPVVVTFEDHSGDPAAPNITRHNKNTSSLRSEDAGASVPDAAELVWGNCLQWLAQKIGKPEKRCRSLIGKWIKKSSAEIVLEAFRSAYRAKTEDPVPYITAIAEQHEAANHDCCWSEGQIQVFNGFAVQLQELLGERNLRKSIDRVSGKIPIAIKGPELQNKLRSLLVDLVERDREQTERYLKAASSNNANRPPSGSVPIKLDDSDRPKTKPRPREEVES